MSIIKHAFTFEFYHGTSSKFLQRILKEGLSSSPRERVWEESKRDVGEIGFESYPGAYVSNNFMLAYVAAQAAVKKFGGNILVVVGKAETRSPEARLDEDHIHDPGKGIAKMDKLQSDWYKHVSILDHFAFDADETTIRDAARTWMEKVLKIHPTEELMNRATAATRAWLDARVALALERETSGSYIWTGIIGKLSKRFGDNIPDVYMKPQKAIEIYRKKLDDFLAKAKELLTKPERKELLTNVRFTKPITYKGSNKIEAIIEIDEREDPVQIIIHYASNRAVIGSVLNEYQNHVGHRFEVK